MSHQEGNSIAKLSQQIIASKQLEINHAIAQERLDGGRSGIDIGKLTLAEDVKK